MKTDDSVYLKYIFDAIEKIEVYLKEIDEETFRAKHLIQDGVIRQIEIIGEGGKTLVQRIKK